MSSDKIIDIKSQIIADPFYRDTLDHYGSIEAVEEAGFFDTGVDMSLIEKCSDPFWMTTPLSKLRDNLKTANPEKKPCVLVITGSFAPVHDGHVNMMEQAKKKIEENGFEALAGYMVLAHDNYVSTKSHRADKYTASRRYEILSDTLKGSDWLMVDPWLSHYVSADINFTDVVLRLEKYIETHLKPEKEIDVFYVFGADNAYFSRTFLNKGRGICVGRPGYEEKFLKARGDVDLKKSGRAFFVDADSSHASSHIRRQAENENVKETDRTTNKASELANYFIRNDLSWATQSWRENCDEQVLSKACDDFINGLQRALKDTYKGDDANDMKIIQVPAIEQMRYVMQNFADRPCINMDPVTSQESDFTVNVSRLFRLGDIQDKPLSLVQRIDTGENQSFDFPDGDYVLLDDDVATGFSMDMVEKWLPKGVNIIERVSLLEQWFKENHPNKQYTPKEIMDARDFLMGSKMSGLVVELFNGELGRAPYIMPYVSLYNRVLLPEDQHMAFSKKVLELNKTFLEKLGDKILLCHTDLSFQRLMFQAGFKKEDSLLSICRWHLGKMFHL